MMKKNQTLWYRIGYALERARNRAPVPDVPSPSTAEVEEPRGSSLDGLSQEVSRKILDALFTVGAGSVLTRALSLLPGRSGPGPFRLFRAGAAGATAAFLTELIRPLLTGKRKEEALEEELTDVLLAGVGRGLLYAALVAPRIPGPPLLQGAVYGGVEYALSPWGGLGEVAGSQAPHGKIPVLSVLLKDRGADEQLVEHIAFGVALALLYDR